LPVETVWIAEPVQGPGHVCEGFDLTAAVGTSRLNRTLAWAVAILRSTQSRAGTRPVAIVTADLPSLRARDVAGVLAAVGTARQAFVADTDGNGTTMLLTRAAGDPRPRFGPNSAAAHRSGGAIDVSRAAGTGARRDVDLAEDLSAVVKLGVGARTTLALAAQLISESNARGGPPAGGPPLASASVELL